MWFIKYVQHGFTYIKECDWSQCPQCIICNIEFRNSSLASVKLREYFLELYGDGKYKNTMLKEFKVKRSKFNGKTILPGFDSINKPILTALYKVAYLIANHAPLEKLL